MSELPNDATPNAGTVELTESQLSEVAGGLLLPAVQKARNAAAVSSGKMSRAMPGVMTVVTGGDTNGDGKADIGN